MSGKKFTHYLIEPFTMLFAAIGGIILLVLPFVGVIILVDLLCWSDGVEMLLGMSIIFGIYTLYVSVGCYIHGEEERLKAQYQDFKSKVKMWRDLRNIRFNKTKQISEENK